MYFPAFNLDITAPSLIQQQWNEAEVLGSITWLSMHSEMHKHAPLHTLVTTLLPAIKNRQFILASQHQQPIFYLSWANFNAESERRYLDNNPLLMPLADWNNGDRMWILDWVAPFGHTRQITHFLKSQLLARHCIRTLYHRGAERGLKIKWMHGNAITPAEARAWNMAHPIQDKTL